MVLKACLVSQGIPKSMGWNWQWPLRPRFSQKSHSIAAEQVRRLVRESEESAVSVGAVADSQRLADTGTGSVIDRVEA